MTDAFKELNMICKVKDERRRLQMMGEWMNYWTDDLSATSSAPPTREQEATARTSEELEKMRVADLTTQIAYELVKGGGEHGAVQMRELPGGVVSLSLTIIRPRRKRHDELFKKKG